MKGWSGPFLHKDRRKIAYGVFRVSKKWLIQFTISVLHSPSAPSKAPVFAVYTEISDNGIVLAVYECLCAKEHIELENKNKKYRRYEYEPNN